MKKWLLLILCMGWAGLMYFGYMLVSGVQNVNLDKQIEQLNHTEKLLDYQKIDAASKQMYQFFDQFPTEVLKTEDEKMMFHHLEMAAKHAFIFQNQQIATLKEALHKIYLFVDILQGDSRSLWQMQAEEVWQVLGQLIQEKRNFTITEWKKLRLQYERVYPCIYISASETVLQDINKRVENLDFYVENRHTNSSYKEEMLCLQEDFTDLLGKNQKDGMDFSFYLIFFFTGGTILSTLSYVAIRRYAAQKKNEKRTMRSKDL